MSNYRAEFPGFDPATMPAIPADWADVSWHNDACPCFAATLAFDAERASIGFLIWVDYADRERRDHPETPRFSVQVESPMKREPVELIATDDWSAVLATIAGTHFAAVLMEWATPAEWDAMRAANAAQTDPHICHSHDFCDANMAMHEALSIVLGREPGISSTELGWFEGERWRAVYLHPAEMQLFDAAWTFAKARFLTCDADKILSELTAEHEAWCAAEGLECASALDMLIVGGLTADQSEHLEAFCERWDAVQEVADDRVSAPAAGALAERDAAMTKAEAYGLRSFKGGAKLHGSEAERRGWWIGYARAYAQGNHAYHLADGSENPHAQFSPAWEAWAHGYEEAAEL